MNHVADTFDAKGLPHTFHSAAATVYKGLCNFKDIVRNSLNTRMSTPRQKTGAGGSLTLPAIVNSLCYIMRNKGLREKIAAAKVGVRRRNSAGSVVDVESSSDDSDSESVEFAEL